MGSIKDFVQWVIEAFKIWVIIEPWESALIIRMGKRIRKVSGGIYFRFPYLDRVYVQQNRLRVAMLSMQTLTTKCGKAITIEGSIGYLINDIEKLYKTLYSPESTLSNIVKNIVAQEVYSLEAKDINLKNIEDKVLKELQSLDYGLDLSYFKISNFAIVRTFRLIQDQSWNHEGAEIHKQR